MLHPALRACPVPSSGQRADWWSTARIVDRAGRHKGQRLRHHQHISSQTSGRPPGAGERRKAGRGAPYLPGFWVGRTGRPHTSQYRLGRDHPDRQVMRFGGRPGAEESPLRRSGCERRRSQQVSARRGDHRERCCRHGGTRRLVSGGRGDRGRRGARSRMGGHASAERHVRPDVGPARQKSLPQHLAAVRLSVSGRRPVGRHAPAELEHGLVARAQFADVAGYSGPYEVARALGMDG